MGVAETSFSSLKPNFDSVPYFNLPFHMTISYRLLHLPHRRYFFPAHIANCKCCSYLLSSHPHERLAISTFLHWSCLCSINCTHTSYTSCNGSVSDSTYVWLLPYVGFLWQMSHASLLTTSLTWCTKWVLLINISAMFQIYQYLFLKVLHFVVVRKSIFIRQESGLIHLPHRQYFVFCNISTFYDYQKDNSSVNRLPGSSPNDWPSGCIGSRGLQKLIPVAMNVVRTVRTAVCGGSVIKSFKKDSGTGLCDFLVYWWLSFDS